MNNALYIIRWSAARLRPGSGYVSAIVVRTAALQVVLHEGGGRQADRLRPRRGQRRDAILGGARPLAACRRVLRVKDGPVTLGVRDESPALDPVLVFVAVEATRPARHRHMPHDVRMWCLPCIMTRASPGCVNNECPCAYPLSVLHYSSRIIHRAAHGRLWIVRGV